MRYHEAVENAKYRAFRQNEPMAVIGAIPSVRGFDVLRQSVALALAPDLIVSVWDGKEHAHLESLERDMNDTLAYATEQIVRHGRQVKHNERSKG